MIVDLKGLGWRRVGRGGKKCGEVVMDRYQSLMN
jgi:hypothetical protein